MIERCRKDWKDQNTMAHHSLPLVIFEKQLGDGVLLLPTLEALAKRHGKVCLKAEQILRSIIDLSPNVEWIERLEGRKFSEVWVFEPGSAAAWKAFRTDVPIKHLVLRKQSHVRWFHRLVFQDIRIQEHRNRYNGLFFLGAVEPEAESATPKLTSPDEDWRHPDLPSGEYVAISPAASLAAKRWSVPRWRTVLEALSDRKVLILGAGDAEDEKHVAEIIAGFNLTNLMNRTSMRQYLHAISRAANLIAVEGASVHLAAAFGVPAVAIFSAGNEANPLNWYVASKDLRVLMEPGAKWAAHGEALEKAGDVLGCLT